MLDSNTKKRIDDCRNILVGKLPDPKAQIEQITIGLIYKFMDDMDKEAAELGGEARFFSGDYAKYSWDHLFDSKVSAQEMLTLYSEAISSMDRNPNIPRLFLDIFKNAFLPYRDPETLKLFLKTIGEFQYTHSEKLGDAFEYLLSVMGSQGDAGQFRTPRHIIDFLVEAVDPSLEDTILDPACGTAGFLISAFKYICRKQDGDLTPDQRKKMIRNFTGYDISPDMVRLSLVNLYLHGFSDPHIWEYDTLTSEERWKERADGILANPPFMSPKGGIRPHKRFSIQSKRSEVLFVDYIAEHLNLGGRAGIIVPEGVIFQSGKAYKELRKSLVENSLYAVVSLPAGVFNPYSGVKTSILLLDKNLAKERDNILFVKIENDGFSLGAQRNPVTGSQLDEAIQVIKQFRDGDEIESSLAHAVEKERIGENGEWNLSGERYRERISSNSQFKLIRLGDVCELLGGGTPSKSNPEYWENGDTRWISSKHIDSNGKITGSDFITSVGLKNSSSKLAPKGSIIFITRVSVGKYAYADKKYAINQDLTALIPNEKLSNRYLLAIAPAIADVIEKNAVGIGVRGITRKQLAELEIPLPPMSVQEEIVEEIEGYQRIIDGARMVVENYKPRIEIDPEWEMVELGDVIQSKPKNGYSGKPVKYETSVKVLSLSATTSGVLDPTQFKYLDEEIPENAECRCKKNDIYLQRGNTKELVGTAALFDIEDENFIYPDLMIRVRANSDFILSKYLLYVLQEDVTRDFIQRNAVGAAGSMPKINQSIVLKIPIPLPTIEIQRKIVNEIEELSGLINSNKKIIHFFEQKIIDRIQKVWGN